MADGWTGIEGDPEAGHGGERDGQGQVRGVTREGPSLDECAPAAEPRR